MSSSQHRERIVPTWRQRRYRRLRFVGFGTNSMTQGWVLLAFRLLARSRCTSLSHLARISAKHLDISTVFLLLFRSHDRTFYQYLFLPYHMCVQTSRPRLSFARGFRLRLGVRSCRWRKAQVDGAKPLAGNVCSVTVVSIFLKLSPTRSLGGRCVL